MTSGTSASITSTTAAGSTASSGGAGGTDTGPNVDLTDPQLYELTTTPDALDPDADDLLANEYGYLDTRVTPIGKLVVYLSGANGTPDSTKTMQKQLASYGFHVISPHYANDYDIVGTCGTDAACFGDARLEAIEGVDHTPLIDISRANSMEERAARMLAHFEEVNPEGDWSYFLSGDLPRWNHIVVAGISHGASSAGVVGKARAVSRVIMLSGPLDQPGGHSADWQGSASQTPAEAFFALSHTADPQHPGHLRSFTSMGLDAFGPSTSIDGANPPYGGSHELETSAAATDGHSSTQAGGASPKNGEDYVFDPAWRYLFGVP